MVHQELYQKCYLADYEFGAYSQDVSMEELQYIASEPDLWGFLSIIHNKRRTPRGRKIMEAISHQEISFYFFPKGHPKRFTAYHKIYIYFWLYLLKIRDDICA